MTWRTHTHVNCIRTVCVCGRCIHQTNEMNGELGDHIYHRIRISKMDEGCLVESVIILHE